MDTPRCSLLPSGRKPYLQGAIEAGGGRVVDIADAQVLIWADPGEPHRLADVLAEHPGIEWVQLPWAGVEPFRELIDSRRLWTAGQGVYAEPVAELALALALAGLRGVADYARRDRWSGQQGRNLLGARVVLLGAGGIARTLLGLLDPFDTRTVVVRNRADQSVRGAAATVGLGELGDVLAEADLVVLALALTEQTRGVIDLHALQAMPEHAWLVNVARGAHVVTDDLVAALQEGAIAGAGLDVTDPEPLPGDHPLWELDNCLVTPHVGSTPEMTERLLSRRVTDNVRRFAAGEPLLGVVDPQLGY